MIRLLGIVPNLLIGSVAVTLLLAAELLLFALPFRRMKVAYP